MHEVHVVIYIYTYIYLYNIGYRHNMIYCIAF